jgi:hypothetical protein
MLKRFSLLIPLVLILVLTVGCTGTPNVKLDTEFALSIGQSARINSESMVIKFIDVTEDSRCPKDVQCIWAGRVSCDIEITRDGISNRIILTQPAQTTGSGNTFENYLFDVKVSPYPETGKEITKKDYRLSLIVTKK